MPRSYFSRALLAAALSLPTAAFAAAPAALTAWEQQHVDGMLALDPAQPYQNPDLGFALGALPGPAYQGNSNDDGLLVLLGDQRTINLVAGYSTDDSDTREAMTTRLGYTAHGDDAQREPAQWAGRPAEQAQWRDGSDLAVLMVQYRPDGDDTGVVYSAELHTTPDHQQEDIAAFRQVLQGFRWLAMPSSGG